MWTMMMCCGSGMSQWVGEDVMLAETWCFNMVSFELCIVEIMITPI